MIWPALTIDVDVCDAGKQGKLWQRLTILTPTAVLETWYLWASVP
jgi:hypothetical protein